MNYMPRILKFEAFTSFRFSFIVAPTVFLLFNLKWLGKGVSEASRPVRKHVTPDCAVGKDISCSFLPGACVVLSFLTKSKYGEGCSAFVEGGGSDEGQDKCDSD